MKLPSDIAKLLRGLLGEQDSSDKSEPLLKTFPITSDGEGPDFINLGSDEEIAEAGLCPDCGGEHLESDECPAEDSSVSEKANERALLIVLGKGDR